MNMIDAILKNDIAKVKQLLRQGVDANFAEDAANITALHHAAQHNLVDIAQILISAGAKVDATTEEGLTPLSFAKIHGHKEMIDFLVKMQNLA